MEARGGRIEPFSAARDPMTRGGRAVAATTPSVAAISTRVVINAVHAKRRRVTYLRNIPPLLAEDARLDLHCSGRGSDGHFHPIDERSGFTCFPPSRGHRSHGVEQTSIRSWRGRSGRTSSSLPPTSGACCRIARDLLRNALTVARVDFRLSRWVY